MVQRVVAKSQERLATKSAASKASADATSILEEGQTATTVNVVKGYVQLKTPAGEYDVALEVDVKFVTLEDSAEDFKTLDESLLKDRDMILDSVRIGSKTYTLQGPEVCFVAL